MSADEKYCEHGCKYLCGCRPIFGHNATRKAHSDTIEHARNCQVAAAPMAAEAKECLPECPSMWQIRQSGMPRHAEGCPNISRPACLQLCLCACGAELPCVHTRMFEIHANECPNFERPKAAPVSAPEAPKCKCKGGHTCDLCDCDCHSAQDAHAAGDWQAREDEIIVLDGKVDRLTEALAASQARVRELEELIVRHYETGEVLRTGVLDRKGGQPYDDADEALRNIRTEASAILARRAAEQEKGKGSK